MSDAIPTIRVLYTCSHCGLVDRAVDVAQRRYGEKVLHWTHVVLGSAVTVDHRRVSPWCTSERMDNVKIPIERGEPIGGSR